MFRAFRTLVLVLATSSVAAGGDVVTYSSGFDGDALDPRLVESNYTQEENGSFDSHSDLTVEPLNGQLSIHGTGTRDAVASEGHLVGWIGRCLYLPIENHRPLPISIEVDLRFQVATLSHGGSDSGYMGGVFVESGPADRINFYLIENVTGGAVQVAFDQGDEFHVGGPSFRIERGRTYRLRLELDAHAKKFRTFLNGALGVDQAFAGDVSITRAGMMAAVRTNGDVVDARFDDLSISFDALPFRRGDANRDGDADLSDAIAELGCLFLDGPCPRCLDAGDSNDDGKVDVSDPIYLLDVLFLTGSRLPPPVGECGADPTPDSLPPCAFDDC